MDLFQIPVILSTPHKEALVINNISPNSGISLGIAKPNTNIIQQSKNPITPRNLLLERPPEFLKNKVFQLTLGLSLFDLD